MRALVLGGFLSKAKPVVPKFITHNNFFMIWSKYAKRSVSTKFDKCLDGKSKMFTGDDGN